MKSKGQESIVFEVLISVILMTFVFVIGGVAMKSLDETKCSKEVDRTMSELALSIEKAASVSVGDYYFSFAESSCFASSDINYILIKSSDSSLCNAYCPGSARCYLLKYNNPADPVSPLRYKCVNISYYLNFASDGCETGQEYNLYGGGNKMKFDSGNYLFRSQSIKEPKICVYKMAQ